MPLILKSTVAGSSFTGTASLATLAYSASNAVSAETASFAFTASYLSGSVESASFASTASFAYTASYLSGSIESASYAATASLAYTASYLSGSVETASFAFTASYLSGSIESASYAATASLAYTASYLSGSVETASFAFTASYLSGSIESASYAATASYALTASYLSGSVESFPFTGSAAISGTLDVNPSPSGDDVNYIGSTAGTIATIGKGLSAQFIGAGNNILLGTFNDKTDRGYTNTFPKFVVAAGVNDSFRKNVIDYRIGGAGANDILLLGNQDDAQAFIGKEFTFKRSGSLAGKLTVEEPVEVDIKGKTAISGALGILGAITASADISASAFVSVNRLQVATQLSASFISASTVVGDFWGTTPRLSGSFSGSFNGDFNGTVNDLGLIKTGSEGLAQSYTGSLNILGNIAVTGTASFQSVTASSVIVDQNTLTVYANSSVGLNTAGYVAADTASLSSSGSLLYDVTAVRWESDKNFYAPAISASTAVYIGDGTADETFRLRASGSALYVEIFDGTNWASMGYFVR